MFQPRARQSVSWRSRLRGLGLLLLLGTPLSVPFLVSPVFLLGGASVAQATELREIVRRKRLIVGVKDNLRPLGYRDSSGQLVGFEIDLARRLAQDLLGPGASVELRPLSNGDRLPALLRGEVDVVIAQVTVTGDRRRLVQFSPPYYTSGLQVITNQPHLSQVSALQRLGILRGSDAVALLQAKFPRLTLVPYDSYQAARRGLEQGEVEAFGADTVVLAGWLQGAEGYRALGSVLSVEPLAIALPKGLQHEPLRQAIATLVNRWQAEGWLLQEQLRWGL